MDYNFSVPISQWNVEYYERNEKACDAVLSDLKDWSSIPTINSTPLDNFSDGCFARFEGMVQDILSQEYFYSNFKVTDPKTGETALRSGRFLDVIPAEGKPVDDIADGCPQGVRQPLFCIPVPGINSWVRDYKTQQSSSNVREEHSHSSNKRPHPEEDDDTMEVDGGSEKRKTVAKPNSDEPSVSKYSTEKYFPLPGERGLACIVKHLDVENEFLVNTRIEAVGFLSLSPVLEASWENADAEDLEIHPPPSLVPRLHAVRVKKLEHFNPLLSSPLQLEEEIDAIRDGLLSTLTKLLFGDSLAAEYVICNLLSTVYLRKDGLSLGALSLNIFNVKHPGYASHLYDFLQTLVPCSSYLPLTIENLNAHPFVPRKDYEGNRLISGRLQLADDTLLFADETVMDAGTLLSRGVHNVAALHAISQRQELRYDFTYFQLDFLTNFSLLVLSEGKSMIPTDVPLKVLSNPNALTPIAETFEAAKFFMTASRLEQTRKYLSAARLQDCDMSDTEFVGPAWVDLRQNDPQLKQDDLHRLLVLSRILALSYGRTSLSKRDWEKAVDMENARKLRLSVSC